MEMERGNSSGNSDLLWGNREDTEQQTKSHTKHLFRVGERQISTPGTRCSGVFGAGEHKDVYRDENVQDSQAGKELMRGVSSGHGEWNCQQKNNFSQEPVMTK